MTGAEPVLVAIATLAVLLALGVPVAFSLAASGLLGIALLRGSDVAVDTAGSVPYSSTATYSLILVPLFIIMGLFVMHAGTAKDLFLVAQRLVGRLPGGLGMATIMACGAFAAVTGSSVATVATIGRMAVGEMRAHGYPGRLAAGIVAAGGTLGVLIPPSLLLVIYGVLTGESIGLLLIAGIVPGVLTMVMYMITIMVLSVRGGWSDEATARTARATESKAMGAATLSVLAGDTGPIRVGRRQNPAAGRPPTSLDAGESTPWRALIEVGLIFVIVMGGIYSGVFTATESGAIGALAAALLVIARRRRDAARAMLDAFRETAAVTSMIFALLVGSAIFTVFFLLAGVPTDFARWVSSLPLSGIWIVVLILLALIPLGMFLDAFSIILITVPLTYPIVTELGFDGLWFGILVVKACELGLITPPLGLNVFVAAGVSDDVAVEEAFRGIVPFAITDVVTTIFIVLFPVIVIWLPSLASV